MLIRCGECGREISDAAPSCPHCGILRQLGAAPAGTAAVSRQPFFLIAAAICLFLSLFTPRIVVVLPVLVTVLFGIISIVRRETWRPAAAKEEWQKNRGKKITDFAEVIFLPPFFCPQGAALREI